MRRAHLAAAARRAWPGLVALAIGLWLGLAPPAMAVQPDEILDDPKLEERAREISKELRCLVCRNQSIDDSNADLARDMRVLVRERLEKGDSDAEVKQYLVERYGEFVLLKPAFDWGNALLWMTGPVLFLLGLGATIAYLRGRAPRAPASEAPLTPEEQAALDRALEEDER